MKPAHRLTQYSSGGGCACKLPQSLLQEVLTSLRGTAATGAPARRSALRVGLDPPDDAAVYEIDATRGWIVTCDFVTPVVDDPYWWGRAAATNALSDVYAMGGRPLLALNLLGWPTELPSDMLAEVLRGGAEAVGVAGAVLAGGHSIVDPMPKYGLAVIGEVDLERMLRKGGGVAGDVLVLTKALGVGIVSTAVKRSQAAPQQIEDATASMVRLNAAAAAVAQQFGLRGGTDVTGYGLIGHLHEMALDAGMSARLFPERAPRLKGVSQLVAQGCAPDGSRRTLDHALESGWFNPGDLPDAEQVLLADAQTSGGLLLAVAPKRAAELTAELHRHGDTAAAVVGELVAGPPGIIGVRPG